MKESVSLTGLLKVRAEKAKEFASIFEDTIIRLKKQKGCLTFKHYIDREDPNSYAFIGIWKSERDAKVSLQTDEFGLLITALDLLEKAPEIRYHHISISDGLNLIRQWRTAHKS